VRILIWHVHGSWTTSFVQGGHTYLLPVTPDRGPDGGGRAATYDWPDSAVEVPVADLRHTDVDLVVLQRPHELRLAEQWLGRRLGTGPGRDVPAVYLEHNTPKGEILAVRHPVADRDDIPLVHVTHFNALFWDNGRAPVSVIEHGIVDPGERYTGELERAAVAVNEPIRRGRVTGTDLLPAFARVAPLDVYGMKVAGLPAALDLPADRCTPHDDAPQHVMHAEMARRRVYVHPIRWTSLGLSLLEAMHLGMPVVVLASTEAVEAVPPGAGVLSTRLDVLTDAVRSLLGDPLEARRMGKAAREAALARYSLDRFLTDWDDKIQETTR
jgi:glycosyltransferase involved in cell wall biosynthesis